MRNLTKLTTMLVALFSIAVLTLGGASVLAQQSEGEHSHGKMKKMEEGKAVTLEGEVLDLYCYMKHPDKGQGAEHIKCAKSCIRKGMPIGFLVDGEVYLILGQNHEPATDLVVDFAGIQARLTGTLVTHHGVKSIEVAKIEKLDTASGH